MGTSKPVNLASVHIIHTRQTKGPTRLAARIATSDKQQKHTWRVDLFGGKPWGLGAAWPTIFFSVFYVLGSRIISYLPCAKQNSKRPGAPKTDRKINRQRGAKTKSTTDITKSDRSIERRLLLIKLTSSIAVVSALSSSPNLPSMSHQ